MSADQVKKEIELLNKKIKEMESAIRYMRRQMRK